MTQLKSKPHAATPIRPSATGARPAPVRYTLCFEAENVSAVRPDRLLRALAGVCESLDQIVMGDLDFDEQRHLENLIEAAAVLSGQLEQMQSTCDARPAEIAHPA